MLKKVALQYKPFRFVFRVCHFFITWLHCGTKTQREQNGTKKNIKSFLPCEFKCYISFEVSIPAPHTHSHTLVMGNLNATSPQLSYCLKYRSIREWPFLQLEPRLHLLPTWSSLSAALASSPARVSSRCLTGPSTDNTWASSHREGYSWHKHTTRQGRERVVHKRKKKKKGRMILFWNFQHYTISVIINV